MTAADLLHERTRDTTALWEVRDPLDCRYKQLAAGSDAKQIERSTAAYASSNAANRRSRSRFFAANSEQRGDSRVDSAAMERGLLDYLINAFAKLNCPATWIEAGYLRPTENCIRKAASLATEWFLTSGQMPARHVLSRQGGIILEYKKTSNKIVKELCIEIDDDLDVVAVLTIEGAVAATADRGNSLEWKLLHERYTN